MPSISLVPFVGNTFSVLDVKFLVLLREVAIHNDDVGVGPLSSVVLLSMVLDGAGMGKKGAEVGRMMGEKGRLVGLPRAIAPKPGIKTATEVEVEVSSSSSPLLSSIEGSSSASNPKVAVP